MNDEKKIVIASGNKDKILEIKLALARLPAELTGLDAWPNLPEAVEDGLTFAENAVKKAKHYQKLIGLPCLADDSGLCVDALDGAPGVYSARFAAYRNGQFADAAANCDDKSNNEKLVAELKKLNLTSSAAKYVCVLALAYGDGKVIIATGELNGEVRLTPRGSGGFGYDPYFYLPDGRTLAEISREEKNSFSHRGNALKAMAERLSEC